MTIRQQIIFCQHLLGNHIDPYHCQWTHLSLRESHPIIHFLFHPPKETVEKSESGPLSGETLNTVFLRHRCSCVRTLDWSPVESPKHNWPPTVIISREGKGLSWKWVFSYVKYSRLLTRLFPPRFLNKYTFLCNIQFWGND